MLSINKYYTHIILCILCFCLKVFIFPLVLLSAGENTPPPLPEHSQQHSADTETKPVEYSLEDAMLAEYIWFGYYDKVSISTRHETLLGKAPGIITVITEEEIKIVESGS